MTEQPIVVVHFKDLSTDEPLRESIEQRCRDLAREFHEVQRCEISVAADGVGFVAHGHVTGKGLDVATHATAPEVGPAALQVLDKIGRQLRRVHDKRIFAQRREAQRDPPKRKRT